LKTSERNNFTTTTTLETTLESEITCPYCGWQGLDSWEFGQNEGVYDCGACDKEFWVVRDTQILYTTYPKKTDKEDS